MLESFQASRDCSSNISSLKINIFQKQSTLKLFSLLFSLKFDKSIILFEALQDFPTCLSDKLSSKDEYVTLVDLNWQMETQAVV
jgi:hypothetical protein